MDWHRDQRVTVHLSECWGVGVVKMCFFFLKNCVLLTSGQWLQMNSWICRLLWQSTMICFAELNFKPSLKTYEFIQLSRVDGVSQGPEETARTWIKASFFKFYYQRCYIVWLPRLPDVICVCGHALCERLNPLLSNDAFMLPVFLCLCLHLPIIY